MLRLLTTGALVLLLGVTGCTQYPQPIAPTPTSVPSTDTPVPPTEAPAEVEPVTVTIKGFTFGDGELTITTGTTVLWQHDHSAPHTVTADDGLFDSANMVAGDDFSFTFTEAGEYSYYCRYHGGPGGKGMAGKIIVTEK